MGNRFKATGESGRSAPAVLSAVFFVVLLAAAVFFLSGLSSSGELEQKKSLESALMRSTMQCYALEGRYPQSLSYLKEHYGISYDETRFHVDYRPVAENLLPDVTVLVIGGDS